MALCHSFSFSIFYRIKNEQIVTFTLDENGASLQIDLSIGALHLSALFQGEMFFAWIWCCVSSSPLSPAA